MIALRPSSGSRGAGSKPTSESSVAARGRWSPANGSIRGRQPLWPGPSGVDEQPPLDLRGHQRPQPEQIDLPTKRRRRCGGAPAAELLLVGEVDSAPARRSARSDSTTAPAASPRPDGRRGRSGRRGGHTTPAASAPCRGTPPPHRSHTRAAGSGCSTIRRTGRPRRPTAGSGTSASGASDTTAAPTARSAGPGRSGTECPRPARTAAIPLRQTGTPPCRRRGPAPAPTAPVLTAQIRAAVARAARSRRPHRPTGRPDASAGMSITSGRKIGSNDGPSISAVRISSRSRPSRSGRVEHGCSSSIFTSVTATHPTPCAARRRTPGRARRRDRRPRRPSPPTPTRPPHARSPCCRRRHRAPPR